MASVDQIPKTYEEAVKALAQWHAEGGPVDLKIFSQDDPAKLIVRLVEISAEFPPAGEVRGFPLGRSAEFPFRSDVILLTPREWEHAKSGQLKLPEGWDLKQLHEVWPNDRG